MTEWPEDMRTINVKMLAKIVRALQDKIESLEQGSLPSGSPSPSETASVSPAGGGALTF